MGSISSHCTKSSLIPHEKQLELSISSSDDLENDYSSVLSTGRNVHNINFENTTELDDNKKKSTKIPHSLQQMMQCEKHSKALDNLKFLTDLQEIKEFLVKSGKLLICPRDKLVKFFAHLKNIKISMIQTCEEKREGIIPHFFNQLSCKGLTIFIEFFQNSHIQVSILKEAPYRQSKLCGDCRPVDESLEYWIRKALTNWNTYSLIFNSCLHHASDLKNPNSSSNSEAERALVNFPKTISQAYRIIREASKPSNENGNEQISEKNEPGEKKIKEKILCAICNNSPPDYAFLPCGHRGSCEKCAKNIFSKGKPCPLCRMDVRAVIRIYDVLTLNN